MLCDRLCFYCSLCVISYSAIVAVSMSLNVQFSSVTANRYPNAQNRTVRTNEQYTSAVFTSSVITFCHRGRDRYRFPPLCDERQNPHNHSFIVIITGCPYIVAIQCMCMLNRLSVSYSNITCCHNVLLSLQISWAFAQ